MVFFELRKANFTNVQALSDVSEARGIRGFSGGIILRHEDSPTDSGEFYLSYSETESNTDKNLAQGLAIGKSIKLSDNCKRRLKSVAPRYEYAYEAPILIWDESVFSRFAFDLIAMLQGTFARGRISSWYGLGTAKQEQ